MLFANLNAYTMANEVYILRYNLETLKQVSCDNHNQCEHKPQQYCE